MDNYTFRTSTYALPHLLGDLLANADEVGSRNGRTKEFCHLGITLTEPWKRELLLPARKHNLAAQIAETMWVLAGRDDIEFLSNYLPRAADYSDDGAVWRGAYGPRIRGGVVNGTSYPDQIKWVVDELKATPLTRQAVVSIYDATRDCGVVSKDIPCNDFMQFTNRLGKLDLHVYIRSNDALWGWSGINVFEWSALQEIVAGLVGVDVGSLHFSVGSFHVYEYHWKKAQEIIDGGHLPGFPFEDSPAFKMPVETQVGLEWANNLVCFDQLVEDWFRIEGAIRLGHDVDDAIVDFPEPMLQSWLRVIAWWWSGDYGYLDELPRLRASASIAVQPKVDRLGRVIPETGMVSPDGNDSAAHHRMVESWGSSSPFLEGVYNLHQEKAKAYGDSWKRRGEMLGIMANIARKLDRFGRPDIDSESAADAALDLMVYLAMYRWWLTDQWAPAPMHVDVMWKIPYSDNVVEPTRALLLALEEMLPKGEIINRAPNDLAEIEERLTERFDELEGMVMSQRDERAYLVDAMLVDAFILARARHTS